MTTLELRTIDYLVATMVMGWTLTDYDSGKKVSLQEWLDNYSRNDGGSFDGSTEAYLWTPSSNMESAWQVWTELEKKWEIQLSSERAEGQDPNSPLEYRVDLREHYFTTNPGPVFGVATAPLAICLAAIKAQRREVPA